MSERWRHSCTWRTIWPNRGDSTDGLTHVHRKWQQRPLELVALVSLFLGWISSLLRFYLPIEGDSTPQGLNPSESFLKLWPWHPLLKVEVFFFIPSLWTSQIVVLTFEGWNVELDKQMCSNHVTSRFRGGNVVDWCPLVFAIFCFSGHGW